MTLLQIVESREPLRRFRNSDRLLLLLYSGCNRTGYRTLYSLDMDGNRLYKHACKMSFWKLDESLTILMKLLDLAISIIYANL